MIWLPDSHPSDRLSRMMLEGQGKGRKMRPADPYRVGTPDNQQGHHDGGYLHNLQCLVAGFGNALDIFPPEIQSDADGETRGRRILGEDNANVKIGEQLVHQSGQVLPRGHAADRAGQNIIEHQGRYGKFRERPAERFLDHAIHAATHEHAAALDIHGANAVGKQHHAQDEPGRRLPDKALRLAARVIRGRRQVIQNNGGCAPEGDKRQHGGRRHDDPGDGYYAGRFRAFICRDGGHKKK